jgi:hypothetical protein
MLRVIPIIACCALTGCATNISGASDALIDSFGNVCLSEDAQDSKMKRALEEGWIKIQASVDNNLDAVKFRASQNTIDFRFQSYSNNLYRGKYLVIFSSEITSGYRIIGCEIHDFNAPSPFDLTVLTKKFGPFSSIVQQEGYSADELTAITWNSKSGNSQWMSQYISKSAKIPKEILFTRGSALRSSTRELRLLSNSDSPET